MSGIFSYLMLGAIAMVVLSLLFGLIVMVKGGRLDKKYSNYLMRSRVFFQALAILFMLLAFYYH